MAFYYVRDNGVDFTGTATGDNGRVTIERSGVWSVDQSLTYPSVKSIFADQATTGNTIVDGDVIIIAADHVESYGVSTSLNVQTATIGVTLVFKSVSTIDVRQSLKGATIRCTGGTLNVCTRVENKNNLFSLGVIYDGNGSINFYTRDSSVSFYNSTIDVNDVGNPIYSNYYFYEKTYYKESAIQASGYHHFIDCVVVLTSASLPIRSSNVLFESCDLSGSTTTSVSSYDSVVNYIKCKMPASMLDLNIFSFTRSGMVGAYLNSCDIGGKYFFEALVNYYFTMSTTNLTYLNYTYDGVNKASKLLETKNDISKYNVARIKLCELPAQDLSLGDKTYRVQLLLNTDTVANLTDTTFWLEVHGNNNTELALGEFVSSRNTDILSTGVELTVSAETWQGTLPTNNQAYQIDVTFLATNFPNVSNADIIIYACLAEPNVDVYIDPAVQIGT